MSSDEPRSIVSIDPGRAKCGIAFVCEGAQGLVERQIVPTEELVVTISRLLRKHPEVSIIIIGSGTGSVTLSKALKSTFPTVPVQPVDEQGTSLLARVRYMKENPPRGWKRFVPAGLLVPSEPYDDYAALLLAERYLERIEDK